MDQQSLREWEHRCIQEELPFCQAACPLHVDVRAMLDKLAGGDSDGARRILERTMPLPGVLGLLCEAPCEVHCKRTEAGEALAIGALERFLVTEARPGPKPLRLPGKKLSALVLGRGLAALTCAWDLLKKGYGVRIHTLGQALGGALLTHDDPALPAALERELAQLTALGLEIVPTPAPAQELLAAILAEGRAVFLEWGFSPETDANYPPRSSTDPVTLAGAAPGLFLGGWPDAQGRFSAINATADGRRAASSLDRQLSGVSLTASREREGASGTLLFTSLAGVEPLARIAPTGPKYTAGEAVREADRCLRCQCLECVKVCTYLERFKSYPRQYARQIYNNAAIVKGQHLANSLVNSCSLCGLCGRVCPQGFDMAVLNLHARREMIAAGTMPPSAHEFALEDMEAASGPECALLRPDPATPTDGGAAHLFFPGCQLSASHPQHVHSAYELLRAQLSGGVGLMLRCCGIPANWAGREEVFANALAKLRADWESLGRPRIIAACAGCLSVLRDFAPDISAVSLWEALEGLELPEQSGNPDRGGEQLALHDPCTARDNAPFRLAARALAKRLGLATAELALSGELTECCGFGGLMSAANAPLAHEVAARRAARSPLDYLATCAMCRDRLAAEGKRAWHLLDFVFPDAATDPKLPGPGPSARREARARLKRELLSELWGEQPDQACGVETGATATAGLALDIPAQAQARLDERRILASDVRQTLEAAQASGRWFAEIASGRRLAAFRPRRVTFWAEYRPQGAGFELLNAWSHRMVVPGVPGPTGDGTQSESETLRHAATVQRADQTYLPADGTWTCACSGKPLAPRPVDVTYLGSVFTISLLTCPDCGLPLVPESLALGRMAEVEQLLEDK